MKKLSILLLIIITFGLTGCGLSKEDKQYNSIITLCGEGNHIEALKQLENMGDYIKDLEEEKNKCYDLSTKYYETNIKKLYDEKKYDEAIEEFKNRPSTEPTDILKEYYIKSNNIVIQNLLDNKKYDEAYKILRYDSILKDTDIYKKTLYVYGKQQYESGYITDAYNSLNEINSYEDVPTILNNDVFNIIGEWEYEQSVGYNWAYIIYSISTYNSTRTETISAGNVFSPIQSQTSKDYKIIDKAIYVKDGDTWNKEYTIVLISKEKLTLKSNSNLTYEFVRKEE